MDRAIEALRSKMTTTAHTFDDGEVFDLLALKCFFCCRDGARGGNKSCAPEQEVQEG
jgi:hypothetical protein